jgi:hypothetical protein
MFESKKMKCPESQGNGKRHEATANWPFLRRSAGGSARFFRKKNARGAYWFRERGYICPAF